MKSALASISEYLKEWLASVSAIRDAATAEEMARKLDDFAHLPILSDGNFVNKSGYDELRSAAKRILIETGDELKLGEDTAINAILSSQKEEIERLRSGCKFSEHRLLSRAKKLIEKTARTNGIFVVPLFLAPESKETDFEIGPVRVLSASCFAKESRERILAAANLDDIAKLLCDDWLEYSAKFDHFMLVNIIDHDLKCGMATAYKSATVLLNLIRTFFGYHYTKDVRISGDFIRENYVSYAVIQDIGDVAFGTSWGPRASHLDDAALAEFFKYIDESTDFFGRLIGWISRTGRSSPAIFDRIVYANELISEAYGEPNSKIKVVRLIAALEALAVLPREEKIEVLSSRCALAATWDSSVNSALIREEIRSAYKVRNAIVHGDGATEDQAMIALLHLDRSIFFIYVGFLRIFAIILNKYKPRELKHLRRIMRTHFDEMKDAGDRV